MREYSRFERPVRVAEKLKSIEPIQIFLGNQTEKRKYEYSGDGKIDWYLRIEIVFLLKHFNDKNVEELEHPSLDDRSSRFPFFFSNFPLKLAPIFINFLIQNSNFSNNCIYRIQIKVLLIAHLLIPNQNFKP